MKKIHDIKFQNALVTDWLLQFTCSLGTKHSSRDDKFMTGTFYYLQIPQNTVKINFGIFVTTIFFLSLQKHFGDYNFFFAMTKISKLIFTMFFLNLKIVKCSSHTFVYPRRLFCSLTAGHLKIPVSHWVILKFFVVDFFSLD